MNIINYKTKFIFEKTVKSHYFKNNITFSFFYFSETTTLSPRNKAQNPEISCKHFDDFSNNINLQKQ